MTTEQKIKAVCSTDADVEMYEEVTDPVEAYFATSEDLYEIVEYEVQA